MAQGELLILGSLICDFRIISLRILLFLSFFHALKLSERYRYNKFKVLQSHGGKLKLQIINNGAL